MLQYYIDMKKLRLNSNGFTVIELLVFIIVIVAISLVAVSNIRDLRASNRDQTSKVNINAIFYQLELFHEKNGFYPESIDATSLKGIAKESLNDRNGIAINKPGSVFSYKPRDCSESKCKSFELKTKLEKEAPFIKQSLNQ